MIYYNQIIKYDNTLSFRYCRYSNVTTICRWIGSCHLHGHFASICDGSRRYDPHRDW